MSKTVTKRDDNLTLRMEEIIGSLVARIVLFTPEANSGHGVVETGERGWDQSAFAFNNILSCCYELSLDSKNLEAGFKVQCTS